MSRDIALYLAELYYYMSVSRTLSFFSTKSTSNPER